MKCLAHLLVTALATMVAAGCGSQDRPKSAEQPTSRTETADPTSGFGEKASLDALKELEANVALDEEGRAKVVRLSGPKVTDAELEHVGALTNLRALYLEGVKVTDAGMAHLKPLTKLETLHCASFATALQHRPVTELKATTELMFIQTPLTDVLDTLGDFHDIPFKIDDEALEAAGIPSDTPITAEHRRVPLREALNAMLEPLGLVLTLDSGTVVVTTEEAFAKEHPNLTELRQAVPGLKDVFVDW